MTSESLTASAPPAEGAEQAAPAFEVGAGGAIVPREGVAPAKPLPRLAYRDETRGLWMYEGDCLAMLDALAAHHPEGCCDTIFADPPYFLSNGGMTCQSGRRAKVNKGEWDKSRGVEANHRFNLEWLRRCQRLLKPGGTIWVTGTLHAIFSAGFAMQQLGMKLLNEITWEKPNPPPNLSCRFFTHSTETLIWAARDASSRHTFDYQRMRKINGGRQMKTVWRFTAPSAREKRLGRHPAQKPLALVERCLLASTCEGDMVLDPFLGSGTTAVAASRAGRRCIGIESDPAYLKTAVARLEAELI